MANMKRRDTKRQGKSDHTLTVGFATKGSIPGAGFLATAKLKKAGGSLVMTVPAAARNMLGLTEGQEMAVSVRGTQVIVEPMPKLEIVRRVRRPKYTLDELVAGYDAEIKRFEDERAWMDAPPAGREIW